MIFKLTPLIIKNLLRSQIRFISTSFGCAISAFIVFFFLAADHSVGTVLSQAESNNHIIVSQLDKH